MRWRSGIKYAVIFVFIFAAYVIFRLASGPLAAHGKKEERCGNISQPSASDAPLALVTEPTDGIAPVLAIIKGAARSIDLAIYALGDPEIETALVDAERRGVAVRVMLDPGYGGKPVAMNKEAYELFRADGVPVRFASGRFTFTHEKLLVLDHDAALIATFNLVPKYYPTGRDFGVVDRDPCDVSAIEATFDTDWQGNEIIAPSGDDLVWSPGARPQIISLIGSARRSLDIYNEEMSDPEILEALEDAARRGVAVRIMMTYANEWRNSFDYLAQTGVQIRTYAADTHLYIHAKAIVADDTRAFIGSENFSKTSLDDNRELGIMVADKHIVVSLAKTFQIDWRGGTIFP